MPKMTKAEIEEFLRRSNSICDHDATPEIEVKGPIPVRRMSLAEFTGLDPEQKLADVEMPAWKVSTTQTSLMNSFSERRKSLLSNGGQSPRLTFKFDAQSPSHKISPEVMKTKSMDSANKEAKKVTN